MFDKPFDQTSVIGSVEESDGVEGGKAGVVGGTKLFNDGKFGVGKPNAGNAPNGDIDGKPNGRPQGRSRKYIIIRKKNNSSQRERKKETLLFKVEARSSCCFFVIFSLLLLMVVVIADQKNQTEHEVHIQYTHDHREWKMNLSSSSTFAHSIVVWTSHLEIRGIDIILSLSHRSVMLAWEE